MISNDLTSPGMSASKEQRSAGNKATVAESPGEMPNLSDFELERRDNQLLQSRRIIYKVLDTKLVSRGHLRGKVVDFGSGEYAAGAANLFSFNGDVTAVEINGGHVAKARKCGLLPPDRIIECDGFTHLRKMNGSLDLVTAFMLGPENSQGDFVCNFLDASAHALKTWGALLVTSDPGTVFVLTRLMQEGLYPFLGSLLTPGLWAGQRITGAPRYSLENVKAHFPDDVKELLATLRKIYGESDLEPQTRNNT